MSFKIFLIIFAMVLPILLVNSQRSFGEEGRWEEPWSLEALPGPRAEEQEPTSLGKRVAAGIIGFFGKYISPVDGDRCPSYPTCSQYSLEAIRKHGLLMGWVMTFDGLIHESDETHIAPWVRVNDSYRYFDPVENNDFWWMKK